MRPVFVGVPLHLKCLPGESKPVRAFDKGLHLLQILVPTVGHSLRGAASKLRKATAGGLSQTVGRQAIGQLGAYMLTHSGVITFEQTAETGRMEPVSPAKMREKTDGFTVPKKGLPAVLQEGWQAMRKRLMAQGVAADSAWLGLAAAA